MLTNVYTVCLWLLFRPFNIHNIWIMYFGAWDKDLMHGMLLQFLFFPFFFFFSISDISVFSPQLPSPVPIVIFMPIELVNV